MLAHGGFDKWSYGEDPNQSPTLDEVLDNLTLYWLTSTAASSARIYWENRGRDLIRAFRNVIYFHEADRGGHFAMWEHPEVFAAELRAAFRSLRDAR
jgi:pimeloyl-ACP methyl ester carboxylesterase